MPSSATLIFMVVFCLESLAAMLQNGFVVTVLGREWVRCQGLPASDMIVTCLAASRFCLHGIGILNNFLAFFEFCYQVNYVAFFWNFLNNFTVWLTAWLAIFYCVKISSFSHAAFFWLKWRISRLVPRLLVGSLIICGLSTTSLAIEQAVTVEMSTFLGPRGNCTADRTTLTFSQYYFLCNAGFMWFIPFLLFLVSIFLLMFSLCRHMEQMRDCRPGPLNCRIQAHSMALKSLAFFLIFYTAYFLSLIISVMRLTTVQSHWHWVREVLTYAGIYLHSLILVLSSPKLRKALKTRF
uniref:Taste receptor type 2 n=1 Tax=Sciurus vulgaris TaxID=55149 RepID=A0A8D2B9X4_SCIVU